MAGGPPRRLLVQAAVAPRTALPGLRWAISPPSTGSRSRRWRHPGLRAHRVVCLQQVKAVSLLSLLRPLDHVDLVDLGVQGAELKVLTSAQESPSICGALGGNGGPNTEFRPGR